MSSTPSSTACATSSVKPRSSYSEICVSIPAWWTRAQVHADVPAAAGDWVTETPTRFETNVSLYREESV